MTANLDRSRALQAYLLAIPIVNQSSMRASLKEFGPVNQTDVIWEDLVDPKTVELTANDNTIYNFIWLETRKGPLVAEIPPGVLGLIDDFWYRWVADVNRLMGNSLLDIIVFGRIAGKNAAEFALNSWKDGALNLDHVAAYNKEVVEAGVADGRVAPALLPMYTDERIRERQLTTNYVGNVR